MITLKPFIISPSMLASKPAGAISGNTHAPTFQGGDDFQYKYSSHSLPTSQSKKPPVHFGMPDNWRKGRMVQFYDPKAPKRTQTITHPVRTAVQIARPVDNSRTLVVSRQRPEYSTYDHNPVPVGSPQPDYLSASPANRISIYATINRYPFRHKKPASNNLSWSSAATITRRQIGWLPSTS